MAESKRKGPGKTQRADRVLAALRTFGLAYPGAHTKSPWPGHLDLAVNDKTFAYLSVEGEPFKLSCKLPRSAGHALLLPFTSPTAYSLGKSGWVTARFDAGDKPPLELLQAWIDESYRAQAPKKLLAQLAQTAAPPSKPTATASSRRTKAKAKAFRSKREPHP
ncbi:MAG TPA: MmcQ/YjbR family DNA-binding protein [Polyangia bacterium]